MNFVWLWPVAYSVPLGILWCFLLVCVLCVVCGVNVSSPDGVGYGGVGIVVNVSSPRVWWGI